jgi:hypothetical protein
MTVGAHKIRLMAERGLDALAEEFREQEGEHKPFT